MDHNRAMIRNGGGEETNRVWRQELLSPWLGISFVHVFFNEDGKNKQVKTRGVT